jgi:hypothetical protein
LRSLVFDVRANSKRKVKTTTPALSFLRSFSHVASCGTSRNACATQRHRVALLFGSVPQHLPTNIARLARFSVVLSVVLILVLPARHTTSFAQNDRVIVKVASFAELARQLAANLNKCNVKRIVIVDFEDPIRRVDDFGVWLADQLAAAPGDP